MFVVQPKAPFKIVSVKMLDRVIRHGVVLPCMPGIHLVDVIHCHARHRLQHFEGRLGEHSRNFGNALFASTTTRSVFDRSRDDLRRARR